MIYLLVALALSLAANAWLFDSRDKLIEEKGTVESALITSKASAKECTDSVEAFQREEKVRTDRAVIALAKAQADAKKTEKRAQDILSQGPAVPGDACKSAQMMNDLQISMRREARGKK